MIRRHSSRSRGARRKKQWTGGWAGSARVAPALTTNDSHLIGVNWARVPSNATDPLTGFPIQDDCTLLRTILSANAQVTENGTGPYSFEWWVGVLAWNGNDGTVLPSTSEIPFPSSDQNADWVARCGTNVARPAPVNLAQVSLTPTGIDITASYKSKRKLSSANGLLIITDLHMQVAPGGGSNPWTFYMNSLNWRFLLLEP